MTCSARRIYFQVTFQFINLKIKKSIGQHEYMNINTPPNNVLVTARAICTEAVACVPHSKCVE